MAVPGGHHGHAEYAMRIGEQHRPLRVVVCDEIRRRILEQTYPPGTRLVEEHVAQELGVSRNPVREALRVLEAEGFVDIIPRRGAVVAASPAGSEDLNEVLVALERLAAQLAARKRESQTVGRLEDVVDRAERAVETGDYETVARLGSEFHATVLELADNPHLESVLTVIRNRHRGATHIGSGAVVRSAWVFAHDDGGRGRASVREHRALMDAIKGGDEEAAATITEEHIRASQQAYLDLAGAESGQPAEGSMPSVATPPGEPA